MGPLLESQGLNYILLIGDHVSKWYEAIPHQNQEATTVAKALIDNLISCFDCPANLHSDKGSNFMPHLFKILCSVLRIDITSKTSLHLRGNAMFERINRTIEKAVS